MSTLTSGVSVIVPTFNRAQYLRECLASIVAQSLSPLEILVVDDGSTDATQHVVAEFGSSIRYFRQGNAGKPRALNFAIPHVKGRYVWMFDDDDVALPTAIETRLCHLEQDRALGFVVTSHYLGENDASGSIRPTIQYQVPQHAPGALRFELMKGCFFTMQSMLVRTELLRSAGGFDPDLLASEDYDMMLRLASLARFTVIAEPTFIFRQHGGTRGAGNFRYSAGQRQAIFRKYDAVVGRKLRASTPLGAYLVPPCEGVLGDLRTLEALGNRMIVMASKGLLDEMIADLTELLRSGGGLPPLAVRDQLIRCSQAMCTGYAYDAAIANVPAFLAGVRRLCGVPRGREAALRLAYGLIMLAKSHPGSISERFARAFAGLRVGWHAFRAGRRQAPVCA